MRYELMFPKQLQAAKDKKVPFLFPVGTLEYHGPHCSYGCDGLIAEGLAKRIEEQRDVVLLPTFWYGTSGYAVAGPEKGTVTASAEVLTNTFKDIFLSFLEGGIRNIVVMIHHQFEQESYMPLTLAAASGARYATMEYLEMTRGRGWWGDNICADYYNSLDTGDNPFQWIRVMPCMSTAVQNATGYDHAGQYEASLQAALYPETVNLDDIDLSDEWFIQSARKASPEYGEKMAQLSVEALIERIWSTEG